MSGRSLRSLLVAALCALPGALALPALALAHGEEPAPGMGGGEAEIRQLAMQPARVLAQQANALLHIRHDRHEAGLRLDAALESRDKRDVDVPTLRGAAETLDGGGDEQRVLDLIDEALSKPLGARSGKLFHGGGREFRPAAGAQETVGVIAGAALLALAAAGLWRTRRRPV